MQKAVKKTVRCEFVSGSSEPNLLRLPFFHCCKDSLEYLMYTTFLQTRSNSTQAARTPSTLSSTPARRLCDLFTLL
ncbi:hypothetical protein F511_43853 [Dorcoceras hygrometricum]|uniref:Uncharacterized protein n=1 Tax=Dorcoceras hygrometricum TaxID=472368 RepID=A0A2Z6ZYK7_9LAMI|nr:hypothetical protein F511_43853 [Dorcoceras hygrometricum]